MKKILIVEDDDVIKKELKVLLNSSNFDANYLNNFETAKEEILSYNADLILLDINIPFINGEELLKEIRKESNVPIIMITSKNTEIDEVLSMSYGADDYITKPYNPTILVLRINALFKRLNSTEKNNVYKNIKIYPEKGLLKKEDKEVILTKNEMIIFNNLLINKSKIVTRDELMTDLWNNDEYINDNALTVNVSRLRTKLKDLNDEELIETRKGQGYILK